jgi:hypothetical protein
MLWKRRKENGGFGGERKKFKCKWWMKGGKENSITTGLPPGKSFMFIVREQDRLNTFED